MRFSDFIGFTACDSSSACEECLGVNLVLCSVPKLDRIIQEVVIFVNLRLSCHQYLFARFEDLKLKDKPRPNDSHSDRDECRERRQGLPASERLQLPLRLLELGLLVLAPVFALESPVLFVAWLYIIARQSSMDEPHFLQTFSTVRQQGART
jgi:hypothetical protein